MLQWARLIREHRRAWQGVATADSKKVSVYMGDRIFDQYQLLVEDTARLSDRRQTTNNIYLSANALLLGGVAILIQQNQKDILTIFLIVLIVIAGITLCLDWRRLIQSYREL